MTEVSEAEQELHLIRHLADCIDASNYLDKRAYLLRHIDRLSETLTAAIAALAARPVWVKALEWSDEGEWSNAPGYRVETGDNGRFYVRSNVAAGLFATIEFASSMDDAKAAAQADYESRILAALEDGQ